jgi:hypothetical protein
MHGIGVARWERSQAVRSSSAKSNDSVYDVLIKLGGEDGEFWCEFDDPHCEERVIVTLREYLALHERNDPPLLSRVHHRLVPAAPTRIT